MLLAVLCIHMLFRNTLCTPDCSLSYELGMSKELASKAIQSARQMGTGSAHLQDLKGAAQSKQGWWLDGPLAAILTGL